MQVKEIMTPNPITVSSNTPIGKIREIFSRMRIWSVYITENGKLTGIVTRGDLRYRARHKSNQTLVSEIMSRGVKWVNSNTNVEDAASLLEKLRINGLAVIENGKLCGIVTRYDIRTRGYSGRGFDISSGELQDIKTNVPISETMSKPIEKGVTKDTTPKVGAGFWARLLHTKDLKEWVEIFQDELNTRWRIFDTNLENLITEWKGFKKTQMEITEAYDNTTNIRKEWAESLTSLGNLINKKTNHEKGMWSITQKNRQNRTMKVKQKLIRSDVDEMNFNSMMDYIKQYPELQSSGIIEKAAEKADEKRKEVIESEKLYNQKMKETNIYLNTAKSGLQKIEHELTSFETIKDEGVKKIEGELKKPLNKIRAKYWWTPKEQQRMKLYLYESDRKIGESKDQLKLMKDDLKEYEKREFKPIVTTKFTSIE